MYLNFLHSSNIIPLLAANNYLSSGSSLLNIGFKSYYEIGSFPFSSPYDLGLAIINYLICLLVKYDFNLLLGISHPYRKKSYFSI